MDHFTFAFVIGVLVTAAVISSSTAQLCLTESNKARAENGGLSPLTHSDQLSRAAKSHNDYMVTRNCFDHKCPGEQDLSQRVKKQNRRWRAFAENLVAGTNNCQESMGRWLNSPGHRANLLGKYQYVGCAYQPCSSCTYKTYYTCVYGNWK